MHLSNLILLPLLSSANNFLLIMHFRTDPATRSWTMLWRASSWESITLLKCFDLSVLRCCFVPKKVLWIHTIMVLNFFYELHWTPTRVCVAPACGTNTQTVLQHLHYMANGAWNHELTFVPRFESANASCASLLCRLPTGEKTISDIKMQSLCCAQYNKIQLARSREPWLYIGSTSRL